MKVVKQSPLGAMMLLFILSSLLAKASNPGSTNVTSKLYSVSLSWTDGGPVCSGTTVGFTATATCLGKTPQPTNVTLTVGTPTGEASDTGISVSMNTNTTVVGDTIWATASCEGGPSVSWRVKVFKVVIAPNGDASTVMVGQKVSLDGEVQPSGLTVASKQWTIPGRTVKKYTQTTTAATASPLEAFDLVQYHIDYYWTDGEFDGQPQDVGFSVTVGGHTCGTTKSFMVRKPSSKLESQTTNLSPPIYITFMDIPNPPYTEPWVRFGANGNPAIIWASSVTTPPEGAGQIALVQLAKALDEERVDDGSHYHITTDDKYLLDNGTSTDVQVVKKNAPASTTTIMGSDDSPMVPLRIPNIGGTMTNVCVRNEFDLRLMYGPSGFSVGFSGGVS